MSADPLMLLGPSSCRAIRIQCGKCLSSVSLSVQAATGTVPAACPGCGNSWTETPEATQAIASLGAALRQWTDSEGARSPFLVRLEMAPAMPHRPPNAGA